MPLVRVRIYLGKKLLGGPTRPYASEVTVKAVIDRAIEPLEGIWRAALWAGGKAPAQAHALALGKSFRKFFGKFAVSA